MYRMFSIMPKNTKKKVGFSRCMYWSLLKSKQKIIRKGVKLFNFCNPQMVSRAQFFWIDHTNVYYLTGTEDVKPFREYSDAVWPPRQQTKQLFPGLFLPALFGQYVDQYSFTVPQYLQNLSGQSRWRCVLMPHSVQGFRVVGAIASSILSFSITPGHK